MSTRDLVHRLLAVMLALVLVLAAAELLLRLDRPDKGFVNTGFRTPSRHLARNLPDFRDRPRPGRKAEGTFRVLAMGDSFVWGSGVHPEDAYPLRLERRLAGLASDFEFEVVNWSRSGWNTKQAWKSVEPRLRWLQPDLMLVGFTLNDPEPSNREERARLTEPLHRRAPQARWSRALHRRSAFYRLFWERFESRRQRRAFVSYYESLFAGSHWLECREAMAELRQAAGAMGIPLVLVVLPVFDSQLDRSYAYRPLHRKLAAAAEELEIPVLDLLRTYRRVDARRLAVEPFTDPHPNELAHRLAADKLTDYLIDAGLVPAHTPEKQPRVGPVRRK